MTIEEYYNEFTQDLIAKAGADENFTRSSFVEHMCSILEDEGFITGFSQTDYKNTTKGLAVDAWSFNEELACLTLIVGDHRDSSTLETLTNSDIETSFKRLVRFVETCLKDKFVDSLDEAMPVTELAWMLKKSRNEIAQINLVLVSNAALSTRVMSLPKEKAGGFQTSYEIWDLSRIHRANTSGKAREDMWIDFGSADSGALPCLPAYFGEDSMQSYLLVLPGSALARLYQDYGERLLEQNVRTFLQFRGSINQGMLNTIKNEPHMFFAYNNGLTATAEEVITADEDRRIIKIKNLQIVNGGQTTASIFNAKKKEKDNKTILDKVYVQVKLSVVPPKKVEEIVPKISQYSNTQNKVNAADFFSNHPFHLRIEEFSRRLWAPAGDGSVQETHWFYERARGQYANQSNIINNDSEYKKFLFKNPRGQMFTKTDLAKCLLSFDEVPHEVSLGAQKAFSGGKRSPGFVGRIATEWAKSDGKEFNELWFKNAIAKLIFFRRLDSLVLQQNWYSGYKANIVTYSIAKFAKMVRDSGKSFDFLRIWNLQSIPESIEFKLLEISEAVNDILVNPPEGYTSNVSEWAKNEDCWGLVSKAAPLIIGSGFGDYLINFNKIIEEEKSGVEKQKLEDSIHLQTYVLEKGASHWQNLRDWNIQNRKLTLKEVDILNIACQIPVRFPSDKQSSILVAAEKRALEYGFYPQ